jgi:hypothetical protein
MLLINFSKKASVVFWALKFRTYLMLFFMTSSKVFSLEVQEVHFKLELIEVTTKLYHNSFYVLLVILITAILLVGLRLYLDFQKKAKTPKHIGQLMDALWSQKRINNGIKDKEQLLLHTNEMINARSKSLSLQLDELSSSLNNGQSKVKATLTHLGQYSSSIAHTTSILKKYLN